MESTLRKTSRNDARPILSAPGSLELRKRLLNFYISPDITQQETLQRQRNTSDSTPRMMGACTPGRVIPASLHGAQEAVVGVSAVAGAGRGPDHLRADRPIHPARRQHQQTHAPIACQAVEPLQELRCSRAPENTGNKCTSGQVVQHHWARRIL